MKRTTTLFAVLALGLIMIAPATASPKGSVAQAKAIHASTLAPDRVDVLVNDVITAFPGLEYGTASGYAELPGGIYNVKVVPEYGAPASAAIDADLNLQFYTDYTVIAIDAPGKTGVSAIVLKDDNRPVPRRRAKIRFVHASEGTIPVDIGVEGGPNFFESISFQEVGDYVTVPAGTYDFRVKPAGDSTSVLDVDGVTLGGGRTYTLVATGIVGGSPALGVILTEDSRNPVRNARN